ncbi:MAG: hypothetical protein KDA99_05940, partial [Planctomycetales bacterium]|nr:hypothetical protein [Planctomycetales bacterium]
MLQHRGSWRSWTVPAKWPGLALLVTIVAHVASAGAGPAVETNAQPASTSERTTSTHIAELIEQLAADEYVLREKAQSELLSLGQPAYDLLIEACENPDIEIRLRARKMISQLRIQWIRADDSAAVKDLLRDYDDLAANDRLRMVTKLARFSGAEAIPAMCRIARFDESELLARQAALAVLKKDLPEETQSRQNLLSAISRAVGNSKRVPARWIRAYADSAVDPTSAVDAWKELYDDEVEAYHNLPTDSTLDYVQSLSRERVELLLELGRSDEAAAVMLALADVRAELTDLLEIVDWMMDHQAYATLEELAKRHSDVFYASAPLVYRLAEMHRLRNEPERAAELAKQAHEVVAGDLTGRITTALVLERRGILDWAEVELRKAIEMSMAADNPSLAAEATTRVTLSEMLHDQHRDDEAALTLQPLVDRMQKDESIREAMENNEVPRTPGEFVARMNFFYAVHLQRQSDHDQKEIRNRLEAAIAGDPQDADVLIAMYRLPNSDEAWQNKTKIHIQGAAQQFRREIVAYENRVQLNDGFELTEHFERALANSCNQYAWLVSNTEGDYQDALRKSERSLELMPDTAGFLDTLGRCHYAVGDLERAVEIQRRAVELEPHSGLIRGQLEFFEAAANARKNQEPQ